MRVSWILMAGTRVRPVSRDAFLATWPAAPRAEGFFYFLNPFDSHYLDALIQGLYARMNTSPLEVGYWRCTPYLLGTAQATKYSVLPRPSTKTAVPVNSPDDWLRQAMSATLARRDWEFDFAVQIQTDQCRMPIEDASIEWPVKRSPFITVARIYVPRQNFATPVRILLAREFSFTPWHSIAEHRPLGNQNRARLRMYSELSRLRQAMNHEPHMEPASDEVAGAQACNSGTFRSEI